MNLLGATVGKPGEGVAELPTRSHYFIGNQPGGWHAHVANYARVRYREVYPGIDVVYYGAQQSLEYDFILAPGASAEQIRIGFEGATRICLNAEGDLEIMAGDERIRQHKPSTYQDVNGVRRPVACDYVLRAPNQVGFAVRGYDAALPLVIDPVITYSTYLAGDPAEIAFGLAVDKAGNAYVVGVTASLQFPATPGVVQPARPQKNPFGLDAFVAKLNPEGTGLVYATYLGGTDFDDQALSVAVDSAGNALVAGETESTDFPTTAGAYKTVARANSEGFVTKLNAAGDALLYSTLLGGNHTNSDYGDNFIEGIAIDSAGDAYVTGVTDAIDFPTTAGAIQKKFRGVTDAFVARMNATGRALIFSTYLGGDDQEFGAGIAVDADGNAYVTGATVSANFPTTPGAFQTAQHDVDAFVSKINASGTQFIYSTYLGGAREEAGYAIAADSAGQAYVMGVTDSMEDFPTTAEAFQTRGSGFDTFVCKFTADGRAQVYSTLIGGSRDDLGTAMAVDGDGNVYVTGHTNSNNFPVTPEALQATRSGAAFFKSTDRGAHWSDLPAGLAATGLYSFDIRALAIAPTSPPTFYAATFGYGIYKTTSGATGWQAVAPRMYSNYVFLALAIDETNPATVYAGTYQVILKTTDGGATWGELHIDSANNFTLSIAVDPANPTTLYAGADTLFKSTDGGATWRASNAGLTATSVTTIVIAPGAPQTIYAAGSGGVFKSTDGGEHWGTLFSDATVTAVWSLVIDPSSPTTLYAATVGLGVIKSTDGGGTWKTINNGLPYLAIRALAIDPADPLRLYLASRYGGFFASTDGGDHWQVSQSGLTSDVVNSIVISPTDPATLFLGANEDNEDAFVVRLNARGSALLYASYLGGGADDWGQAIAVDRQGAAYVTGFTVSPNFSTSPGAFQPAVGASLSRAAAFVSKVSALRVPRIAQVAIKGKKLIVNGDDFAAGASILIDGQPQATINDAQTAATTLIAKRGGKAINPLQSVRVQVRNPDGSLSQEFRFTRPAD